jgi:iron complex outermembrane receptor protein
MVGVRVTVGRQTAQTDGSGNVTLRVPAGAAVVVVSRIGFAPDTIALGLRPGQDTTVVATLLAQALALEGIVVAATRSERRVEDIPLRVEVVDEEEVAEKVAMTPGDIAMTLNETSGLRVQTTSPSLGGANVRVQGLRGRYTLLLLDGLPLHGGQVGGLGLLQIPPVDLGRVEIIKGTATALYGSSALGGVVNLISRRPAEAGEREVLINQTSRGGTDGVLYLGTPLGHPASRWSGTFLASAHRQSRTDVDGDGWADMPGYRRLVVRPRLFYATEAGSAIFATLGYTTEDRDGGTLAGQVAPDGLPYPEGLRTDRGDFGAAARISLGGRDILSVRGSGVTQTHRHDFGTVREDDRHRTWFAEASWVGTRGRLTTVLGAAYQEERYRNAHVAGFDYVYRMPAAFAQLDLEAASRIVISGSARLDAHSAFGTVLSPRLSALLRMSGAGATGAWTTRLSAGAGAFAPVPFTEETEVTGLTPLRPLQDLVIERAVSASLDVNGTMESALGRIELNATVFHSRIMDPVATVQDTGTTSTGASFTALTNAPLDTETWGAELLARLVHGPLRITASYTHLRTTEWDSDAGGATRRDVPLAPRHAIGVVASLEQEGVARVGLEVYYTGRQLLADNPYRTVSRPYVVMGILAERVLRTPVGQARLFINAENIGNVRQTKSDPLVLPARGEGGRWTTDAWTDLSGFVLNGGIRLRIESAK